VAKSRYAFTIWMSLQHHFCCEILLVETVQFNNMFNMFFWLPLFRGKKANTTLHTTHCPALYYCICKWRGLYSNPFHSCMPAQQYGKVVFNTWNEALISDNLQPQEDSLCKVPSLVSQLTSVW